MPNGLYVRSSHPRALHCARFTLWQPLWRLSVPTTDAQRAGQTRGVKMSLRSRESVSHYKQQGIHPGIREQAVVDLLRSSPRELVHVCTVCRSTSLFADLGTRRALRYVALADQWIFPFKSYGVKKPTCKLDSAYR